MKSLYYKIRYWFQVRKELKQRRKETRKRDPYIYEE